MPEYPPELLTQSIRDAINDSGASGVLVSDSKANPRKFVIQSGTAIVDVWVYIKTLTHGGGSKRPKDEYRIQLTGFTSPLILNPSGVTVLLGYEPNTQCFAGFDIRKHQIFTGRSPSIQIPINALHTAQNDGFSFASKSNDEIAIGFRPSEFFSYITNSSVLHTLGADTQMVGLLTKAASLEEITEVELSQVSEERQRVVTIVRRLARDTSFRKRVTTAYNNRCAVTNMQLCLVDAAHILPVGAPDSNDEVYNGLCLTPTYHRAYDRALIYLDEEYIMRMNPDKEKELVNIGLIGGVDDFKSYLGGKIHLPVESDQWPRIDLIRKANEYRGITQKPKS